MYSSQHETVKKFGIPRPTKYINRRVMCGGCKFKCCISPAMFVECSEEEQKSLELPGMFPTGDKCRCLGEGGCKLGENRPILCKLSPLRIKEPNDPRKRPSLIVSHWFLLHCPATTDYEFVEMRDGKYVYKRKEMRGPKVNNSYPELVLEKSIEDTFPRAIDMCSEAMDALYGEGTAAKLDKELNEKPEGFGFNG